jgi:hypothetical protein
MRLVFILHLVKQRISFKIKAIDERAKIAKIIAKEGLLLCS